MKRWHVLWAAACLSLWSSSSFAANATVSFGFDGVTSPLQQAGGAEQVMYSSDTVTLDNGVINDALFLDTTSTVPVTAQGSAPTTTADKRPSASLGFASFFSPYLKIYSIPLSWTFFDRLKTEITIPYVDRTLKQDGVKYSADGLGDISLGLTYSFIDDESWDVSSGISASLPTGDVEARGSTGGRTITVPLGAGAASVNFTQNLSYNLLPTLRLFGSGTLRYFTDADYTAYEVDASGNCWTAVGGINQPYCKKHEERGMIISGLVGTEYFLRDDLSLTGRFSVVNVEQGKQSFNGGAKMDSDDSLLAGDLSFTCKWRFYGSATAVLTAIVPVFTEFDADVRNPEDRTWGISFALRRRF